MKKNIHFIHGKESGPWGTKIKLLAEVAQAHDFNAVSLDYSSTFDLNQRVDMLVRACQENPPMYLVGSSMGAWVAIAASRLVPVKGLFLMAPAVGIEGYPECVPGISGENIEIVHGWHDPLIDVSHAINFAQRYACALHIVDDEHRLKHRLFELTRYFDLFLNRMNDRSMC